MTRITKQSRDGYALQFYGHTLSPADATTYYMGGHFGQAPASTQGNTRIPVPRAGIVTSVDIVFFTSGATGTSELSTITLEKDGSTAATISEAVNTSNGTQVIRASMAVAVAAGAYLEIKWVTPTWATNPVGVRITGVIGIS